MNSTELRDCQERLQSAKESVEDVAILLGPTDREQAARLAKIVQRIAPEIRLLGAESRSRAQSGEGGIAMNLTLRELKASKSSFLKPISSLPPCARSSSARAMATPPPA